MLQDSRGNDSLKNKLVTQQAKSNLDQQKAFAP
jgi:hypothetical protein